jgi:hypothetical protein
MSPFLWSVLLFDILPGIIGGLLMLLAFRFSSGPRSSRAWSSFLGIIGLLTINVAVLAFAIFALAIWLALPGADDSAYENPATYLDYLVLAGVCAGPFFVGVALCVSAFKIVRRPKYDPEERAIEAF